MTEGHDILPFLLYALTVAALIAVTLTAAWFIGAKARHGGARTLPFESGVVPVGEAEESRFSVEFYLIAMFFVIFDLETIFIIGWAVAFFELGWRGYIGASVFIAILLIAPRLRISHRRPRLGREEPLREDAALRPGGSRRRWRESPRLTPCSGA